MLRRTFINSFLKCLLALTLFIPLQGMEYATKNDLVLYKKLINKSYADLKTYCGVSNNLDAIIDVAEKSRNGHLMASLIQVCLPPELVQNYIAPYLSEPIATEYKHKLIAYKYLEEHLKIKSIDCGDQWNYEVNHHGVFCLSPKIKDGYTMWKDKMSRPISFESCGKQMCVQRMFVDNKNDVLYSLNIPLELEKDKRGKEIRFVNHLDSRFADITVRNYGFSYYLFSHDCSLLVFGTTQEGKREVGQEGDGSNVQLIGLKNSKGETEVTLKSLFSLDGYVSALCAAHHSNVFVAGSNAPYTEFSDNIGLIVGESSTSLEGHDGPITHVEFSPDDTRLLTCSYDKITKTSQFLLWDTSNIDDVTSISYIPYIEGAPIRSPILKAFFICGGQQIVIMQQSGACQFFDGLTGVFITMFQLHLGYERSKITLKNMPIFIWSSKDKLLIVAHHDLIQFCSCGKSNKWLACAPYAKNPITGIGLTADEKAIVFLGANEKVYRIELYNDQDSKDFDFIEKQATIVQLYDMLNMSKKHKKSNEGRVVSKTKDFIVAMQSYIQKQPNFAEATKGKQIITTK